MLEMVHVMLPLSALPKRVETLPSSRCNRRNHALASNAKFFKYRKHLWSRQSKMDVSGNMPFLALAISSAIGARQITRQRTLHVQRLATKVSTTIKTEETQAMPADYKVSEDVERELDEQDLEKSVNEGVSRDMEDDEENLKLRSIFPPEVDADAAEIVSISEDIVTVRQSVKLLTNTEAGTIVKFSGGAEGIILTWKETLAAVKVEPGSVALGETAIDSGRFLITTTSNGLGGRILDERGEALDGRPLPPLPGTERRTFLKFKTMNERTNQYRPLHTGVLSIDFAVPIGRGQTMLFQGSNEDRDKKELWPDLMAIKVPSTSEETFLNICICRSLDEASALRESLEKRDLWEHCTIFVPSTEGPGAMTVAINAALTLAEFIEGSGGEALVQLELEPMSRVWQILADAAGAERRAKGIVETDDEKWVNLQGTMIRESISERRRFWFAMISRATNSVDLGSVSIAAWCWEQAGGLDLRKLQAYQTRLGKVDSLPRISAESKQKMAAKIKEEAAAEGLPIEQYLQDGDSISVPSSEAPGMRNAEIEELKSITDGHILLKPPTLSDSWSWNVNMYRSLPRLGTDAMHSALISMDAHKTRLRTLQGKDRADVFHDTLGAKNTLVEEPLELSFVEMLMEQKAGLAYTIGEQVVRMAVTSYSQCSALKQDQKMETLDRLVMQIMESQAGKRVFADVAADGEVTEEVKACLYEEIRSLDGLTEQS